MQYASKQLVRLPPCQHTLLWWKAGWVPSPCSASAAAAVRLSTGLLQQHKATSSIGSSSGSSSISSKQGGEVLPEASKDRSARQGQVGLIKVSTGAATTTSGDADASAGSRSSGAGPSSSLKQEQQQQQQQSAAPAKAKAAFRYEDQFRPRRSARTQYDEHDDDVGPAEGGGRLWEAAAASRVPGRHEGGPQLYSTGSSSSSSSGGWVGRQAGVGRWVMAAISVPSV